MNRSLTFAVNFRAIARILTATATITLLTISPACRNTARIEPVGEDLITITLVNIYEENGGYRASLGANGKPVGRSIELGANLELGVGSSNAGKVKQTMMPRSLFQKILDNPEQFVLRIDPEGGIEISSREERSPSNSITFNPIANLEERKSNLKLPTDPEVVRLRLVTKNWPIDHSFSVSKSMPVRALLENLNSQLGLRDHFQIDTSSYPTPEGSRWVEIWTLLVNGIPVPDEIYSSEPNTTIGAIAENDALLSFKITWGLIMNASSNSNPDYGAGESVEPPVIDV